VFDPAAAAGPIVNGTAQLSISKRI